MIDSRPSRFNGLPVVISHDRPNMTLSEDVPVSPDFRKEMNAWMLSFFGSTNLVEDGQVLFVNGESVGSLGRYILVNPRTYSRLRSIQSPSHYSASASFPMTHGLL